MTAKAPSKSQQTREHILETALALFADKGYAETTMRDIAAAADCSLGLAYRYFGRKEEFILALYERLTDEFEMEVAALPPLPLARRFAGAMGSAPGSSGRTPRNHGRTVCGGTRAGLGGRCAGRRRGGDTRTDLGDLSGGSRRGVRRPEARAGGPDGDALCTPRICCLCCSGCRTGAPGRRRPATCSGSRRRCWADCVRCSACRWSQSRWHGLQRLSVRCSALRPRRPMEPEVVQAEVGVI